MVDMKTETQPVENPRKAIHERRERRRLRVVSGSRPPTVKVWAANEALQDVMRHPSGVRFRDSLDEPVEWPNDSFTQRRIADGSVSTEGPASGEWQEPDESLNVREQAAARKPKPKETKENGKSETKPKPPTPTSPPTAA